jgi:hypothetical protein
MATRVCNFLIVDFKKLEFCDNIFFSSIQHGVKRSDVSEIKRDVEAEARDVAAYLSLKTFILENVHLRVAQVSISNSSDRVIEKIPSLDDWYAPQNDWNADLEPRILHDLELPAADIGVSNFRSAFQILGRVSAVWGSQIHDGVSPQASKVILGVESQVVVFGEIVTERLDSRIGSCLKNARLGYS